MLLGFDNSAAGRDLARHFTVDFAKRFEVDSIGARPSSLAWRIPELLPTASPRKASLPDAAAKFLSGSSTRSFASPVASSTLKELTDHSREELGSQPVRRWD